MSERKTGAMYVCNESGVACDNDAYMIRALATADLQFFLNNAASLSQKILVIITPFKKLSAGISNISSRKPNQQGLYPTTALASKFRLLSREAVQLGSHLDTVEKQLQPLQNYAETMIREGKTSAALTAINDLFGYCVASIPKLDKITNNLARMLGKAKGAERLELDSLNYPDELANWIKVLEAWKRTVNLPIRSEELSEAMAAAQRAAGEGRAAEEESTAEGEVAEERGGAIGME